jgi:hypothetical protein
MFVLYTHLILFFLYNIKFTDYVTIRTNDAVKSQEIITSLLSLPITCSISVQSFCCTSGCFIRFAMIHWRLVAVVSVPAARNSEHRLTISPVKTKYHSVTRSLLSDLLIPHTSIKVHHMDYIERKIIITYHSVENVNGLTQEKI